MESKRFNNRRLKETTRKESFKLSVLKLDTGMRSNTYDIKTEEAVD